MGMAQLVAELPGLNATEGLYASFDAATARIEFESAGIPISSGQELYKITSNNEKLRAIDFDKAVIFLNEKFPAWGVLNEVSSTPFHASWKYQKYPLPSQIIGHWLSKFTDCIIFASTKDPNGKNIYILKTDNLVANKIDKA